jgi:hypothetical protein
MGRDEAKLITSSSDYLRDYGLQWHDLLVATAFAVGALPLPNPQDMSQRWERCLEVDADAVIPLIEKRTGMKVSFPDVGGAFGGEANGRAFPIVAFMHLLVSVVIRMLMFDGAKTIVEVGGGFGGLAYFVTQQLRTRYLIYDLPFINALQAYFLYRAMPSHHLILYGEDAALTPSTNTIVLRPAWELLRQHASEPVDLFVSQDSLIEFTRPLALEFLRHMKNDLRGPFLSVNPEYPGETALAWDGMRVLDLVDEVGGFRCLTRSPFPLRLGHLQEIFFCT